MRPQFARDADARDAAIERALDTFEREHGRAPVAYQHAYLVGSLIQYQLDALRYRAIAPERAGRIRERWWRWRTAAPDDRRLETFDELLRGLPVR